MSQYAEETYTIYYEHIKRARKPHTCEACHEVIRPGHTYARIACRQGEE